MIASKRFLPNCLLSTLLVLLVLATELSCFARLYALRDQTYLSIVEETDISARVQNSLTQYFTAQESTTSIPASVYMDAVSEKQIHEAVCANISNAFAYLFGDADTLNTTMDFAALEENVNRFFSDYAEKNNYTKDKLYEEKVAATISVAEQEILAQIDVFKLNSLHSAGLFDTARKALPYLNIAMVGCLAASALVIFMLWLRNRQTPRVLLYWCGCALSVAAFLPLIPIIYVKATDYFAAFVIKSDRIYAAVTGALNGMTNALFTLCLVTLFIGIACVVLYAVLAARNPKAETTVPTEPVIPEAPKAEKD